MNDEGPRGLCKMRPSVVRAEPRVGPDWEGLRYTGEESRGVYDLSPHESSG